MLIKYKGDLKMNVLIFCANWNNRGDESAIRAMIDELVERYPNANFRFQCNQPMDYFPYDNIEHVTMFPKPNGRSKIELILYYISIFSAGRIRLLDNGFNMSMRNMIQTIDWADIAIYAPGGPNIGDNFRQYVMIDLMEIMYLRKTPYVFYAPSMGPFSKHKKRIVKMLKRAKLVTFRESISQEYVKKLDSSIISQVTLDSAFQHQIDTCRYEQQYEEYTDLRNFIESHEKVVGITISDLLWHRNFKAENSIEFQIRESFEEFIRYLINEGYAIIFIPQLFGANSDKEYMARFSMGDCFIVDDCHDCYFQQYLISKLYAVVGMRYHSNIFSAKMGTPFISVAYEQKMTGFMEKAGLLDYCIDIKELSYKKLQEKFLLLTNSYFQYKPDLALKKVKFMKESLKTTNLLCEVIDELDLNR